jgi:apolipoprotein N-acyltransferase
MTPLILLMVLAALGAIAGHVMGRRLRPAWLWAKWAMLLALGGAIYVWGRAQSDYYDGLGAAILIFLMIGPFFLGSLIAGLVAMWRNGRNDTPE